MEKIALACLPTVAVWTQNCGVTLTTRLLWKSFVSLQEVAGLFPRSPRDSTAASSQSRWICHKATARSNR